MKIIKINNIYFDQISSLGNSESCDNCYFHNKKESCSFKIVGFDFAVKFGCSEFDKNGGKVNFLLKKKINKENI